MTCFRPDRRAALRLALAGALPLTLPGCEAPRRLSAVPRGKASRATVLGIPNERFYVTEAAGQTAMRDEFLGAARRLAGGALGDLPDLDLLGISGGGENGAFGAGVLNGWTTVGRRPEFFLVTGVSTGALSAPFAFLGSSRDAQLKAVYTDITLADVAVTRNLLSAALWSDGLADNTPLFGTISRYFDQAMLDAIAGEYRRGRLLLVGSSNLDAQQPVVWNIGAIAASGHPQALNTVRRILLASSAIPAAFSPVLFDVTLDGQRYQEMHVDGGAFAQVFLYPATVGQIRRDNIARRRPVSAARAWVIRNARLDPEWANVERLTYGIAGRAITAMIAASGYNDVIRIYNAAMRDRVDFNLAFIGTDFEVPYEKPFDPAYMRPLFQYGYDRELRGEAWVREPPL
jgi:predicted acylesterase/phospholipase RssA